MRMSNDTYCVTFSGKRTTERYYRDRHGWLKVSNRGRVFRMTAEQVLNHLLPALAFGERLGVNVTIEHAETPYWKSPTAQADLAGIGPDSEAPKPRAATTSRRIASRAGPSGRP